ncbi:MAG: hypothetical protein RMK65_01425 [Anaerolineae bacterium]|nr:hypothetical protein [Anaerolineae bacterium]
MLACGAEGITPEEVLDFSVNSNPFGPHPAVREALACVGFSTRPGGWAGLPGAVAVLCGLPPAQVLVTKYPRPGLSGAPGDVASSSA